jgi:hypothetical protein
VNTSLKQTGDTGAEGGTAPKRRPVLLIVLAILLFAESAFMFVLAVWSITSLAASGASSFTSGIALIVFILMGAFWLLFIGIGTLRMKPWTRASAITWQVLQIAIAVGSFEGLDATPTIGWALLVPALLVILLVLTPQVTAVTRRNPVRD